MQEKNSRLKIIIGGLRFDPFQVLAREPGAAGNELLIQSVAGQQAVFPVDVFRIGKEGFQQ
jgi:hypothetical protein